MIPIDDPVREDTGLLGSPCFEIPRAVDRDLNFEAENTEHAPDEQLDRKNRSNLRSMAIFLVLQWLLGFAAILFGYLAITLYAQYGVPAVVAVGGAFIVFTVGYYVLSGRMSLAFRRMKPRDCLILDDYFWTVEHHWRLTDTPLKFAFAGTPFRNFMNRLLGTRTGKKVFDEGAMATERTLVEIGDHCTLGEGAILQSHSLEEGVFKSDMIKIGNGCTLAATAFVHYATELGAGSVLDADSFLMKGEVLAPGTRWRGNPAKRVGGGAPAAVTPSAAEAVQEEAAAE